MTSTWLHDAMATGPRRVSSARRTVQQRARVLHSGARTVLQPIISVATGSVLAVEALTRFVHSHGRTVEQVFADAHSAGYGTALETTCVRSALAFRRHLPPGTLMTINLGPDVLGRVVSAPWWPGDLTGVIIEVTEQDVHEPLEFRAALAVMRERGAAIAIDDVGSGYAGLLRVADIRPDYVKVDRHIVTGVGDNAGQAAVLESLVTLSHRLGAAVIAEGVEDLSDLRALGEFDVDYAQGYAIARPAPTLHPISEPVIGACRVARQAMLRGPAAPGHDAARTRDVYAVTAALAAAGDQNDLNAAISAAAAELGVDVIGVSIVGTNDTVREIAITGGVLDPNPYALADYPATSAALVGGAVEVQADDPTGDPAEKELLHNLGHASLLMTPILANGLPIGVLELTHRTPRRWSASDIANAQGLAAHLGPVLTRLGVAVVA